MLSLLQQVLVKQDILLKENELLKEDMATQQVFIDNLSRAVASMKNIRVGSECTLTNDLSIQATTAMVSSVEHSLKEQTNKKLQSKRIDQLLNSTPFSGSNSQEVSDWIEDFNSECDQLQLDDTQRFSIATDLLVDNAKLWYETHKTTITDWVTLKNKLTSYLKARNWH
jgi:hypothetical protein